MEESPGQKFLGNSSQPARGYRTRQRRSVRWHTRPSTIPTLCWQSHGPPSSCRVMSAADRSTLSAQVNSPSARVGPSRSLSSRQSGALIMSEQTIQGTEYRQDLHRTLSLDVINRLYEERGEKAAHTFCIMHRAIASVCMSCRHLFRVVDSQGSAGGLSHGWCSARCVQYGAARAKAG